MWKENKTLILSSAAIIVFVCIAFLLLITWITSRVSMIVVKSLAKREVHIRQFWRETKAAGNSLFSMNVFFIGLPIVCCFVLIGLVFLGIKTMEWGGPAGVGLVLIGFCLVALIFIYLILFWVINSFIPIVLYAEGNTLRSAFRRVFEILKTNLKKVCLYLFFYVLFSLALSIAMLMIFGFVFLLGSIPAVLGGGLVVVLWTKISTILAVLVGAVGGLLGIVVVAGFIILGVVPLQTMMTYLRMELVGLALKNPVNQI